MRNPKRIKPYCDVLATLWQAVPDLRLTQFMYTLMNGWKEKHGSDAFYVEDEAFLAFCLEYLNEITGDSNE